MAESIDAAGGDPSDEQLLLEIANTHPDVRLPGYWELLADQCKHWAGHASISPLWKAASDRLPSWVNEYRRKYHGPLKVDTGLPGFQGKGADRIRTKTIAAYRAAKPEDKATLWPPGSPAVPQINDLVRTRVVVSYLDGIEFLATKLQATAKDLGTKMKTNRKASSSGYYALHLYFTEPFHFRINQVTQSVTIQCEVQIGTELATTLWNATHRVYEVWREIPGEDVGWEWKPDDPRFLSRQLGHMIHLVDGLLIRLRDQAARKKGK